MILSSSVSNGILGTLVLFSTVFQNLMACHVFRLLKLETTVDDPSSFTPLKFCRGIPSSEQYFSGDQAYSLMTYWKLTITTGNELSPGWRKWCIPRTQLFLFLLQTLYEEWSTYFVSLVWRELPVVEPNTIQSAIQRLHTLLTVGDLENYPYVQIFPLACLPSSWIGRRVHFSLGTGIIFWFEVYYTTGWRQSKPAGGMMRCLQKHSQAVT